MCVCVHAYVFVCVSVRAMRTHLLFVYQTCLSTKLVYFLMKVKGRRWMEKQWKAGGKQREAVQERQEAVEEQREAEESKRKWDK